MIEIRNTPLSTREFTVGSAAPALFGRGTIAQSAAIVSRLGQKRALIVTDAGVASSGALDSALKALLEAGIETRVFDGVHPNPSTATLEAGGAQAREFGPAVVVAIGGGSVLDAAKGIALMGANSGSALEFYYRIEPAHSGLPLGSVPPTTRNSCL